MSGCLHHKNAFLAPVQNHSVVAVVRVKTLVMARDPDAGVARTLFTSTEEAYVSFVEEKVLGRSKTTTRCYYLLYWKEGSSGKENVDNAHG